MQDLHTFEMVVNLLLQSLGGWLVAPAKFFTFLGSENFFFLVLPVIYWSISPMLGLRVALILIFSNGFNFALKLAFHGPRPYWLDPGVKALASEISFGVPSNHAQTATAVWGLLGWASRRGWGVILAASAVLLIGVSRLVLGVHFASDVVAGWALGGLLLAAFVQLDRPVRKWIGRLGFRQLAFLGAGVAAFFVALILGANAALGAWQLPAEWSANAVLAGGGAPDPRRVEDAFTLGGSLLGLLVGAAWTFRLAGGFSPAADVNLRILSYLVGLAGVLLFWYGLGAVFPREANLLSYALRFARYTLVGVWISAGAPWLFKRLRLVK